MKKTVAQWDGDWLDIFWYGATEPDRAGEWDQRDGFGILRFEGSGQSLARRFSAKPSAVEAYRAIIDWQMEG